MFFIIEFYYGCRKGDIMSKEYIDAAKEKFGIIIEEQLARVEKMKEETGFIDYTSLDVVNVGVCFGDGIGEIISKHAEGVLRSVLKEHVDSGKIVFKHIKGLTIENRSDQNCAIPEDVLTEIKASHVILKGPTTTPQKGDQWSNVESANVAMRRYLDLFANVRPVKIPALGIDWTFFRENTEGAYVLGSRGMDIGDDVSFDFKVITEQGAERICRMAFDYARNNGYDKVTVITKSNVVKTTDGRFSEVADRVSKDYSGISLDEWYIDIMTAKLLDESRRADFKVMVMPNLYGDILTDEAAQIQGGVGTAGSANIGKQWAMFEAIHGSAPRMVAEGRAQFADPCSMIKAAAMLCRHIGFPEQGAKIEMALEMCGQFERKVKITGRDTGATGEEYTSYVLSWVDNANLKGAWDEEINKIK